MFPLGSAVRGDRGADGSPGVRLEFGDGSRPCEFGTDTFERILLGLRATLHLEGGE
jgi:hypothetical protein